MSLKSHSNLTQEQIWRKRYNHLLKTMLESGYVEIKEYEYRQVNKGKTRGYLSTARIGFKYFKLNSQQESSELLCQNNSEFISPADTNISVGCGKELCQVPDSLYCGDLDLNKKPMLCLACDKQFKGWKPNQDNYLEMLK